ncbi:FAD synthetase 2, chloroplastic-like isoform X1 [Malus sylvestris]|uniref:FAD synthetase 2, chloroplastic-like isoform X1 n=1 Tax=Malus domestica TaxID=3750 RepID=UPI0010AA20E1|nr:FAD synthetase 2, chloroplastic-like isoform X1 [Malus domestica]XP_050131089.1 FAD synthetase 2, chloroplastic-like isoform X1 [Malus sylvestris]
MLGGGGGCSRLSTHLRLRGSDINRLHVNLHHPQLGLGFGFVFVLGLGSYNTRIAHLRCCPCPPPLKPLSLSSAVSHSHTQTHTRGIPFPSILACSKLSSSNITALSHCFSQREGERELPPEGLSSVAGSEPVLLVVCCISPGGIVALGKFDALHIGHRELAIQASKVGPPFLLSFVGMAEVLGWEPRAPIVAKCDRKRVLSSWAPYCGDMAPAEFQIEFSSVRCLTPRQFVEKLVKELGVRGVVTGENYRFGYKAAGDATELVRLCEEYGIEAYIINSVMDKNEYSINIQSSDLKDRGQVSSTRVRRALAVGDMKYVSQLLGRQHRLIMGAAKDQEGFTGSKHKLSVPKSGLLNLAPKEGLYEKCYLCSGEDDDLASSCRVVVDTGNVHIEMDDEVDVGVCNRVGTQDLRLLRIEFGDSQS